MKEKEMSIHFCGLQNKAFFPLNTIIIPLNICCIQLTALRLLQDILYLNYFLDICSLSIVQFSYIIHILHITSL